MNEFEETPGGQFSGKTGTKRISIKGKGSVCDTFTGHKYSLSGQLYSFSMETSVSCSHISVRGRQLQQCFESFFFSNSCFPKEVGLISLIAEPDNGN